MIDLNKIQKQILTNKIDKGFNTKDINFEFNLLYSEIAEAFQAYRQKLPNLKEELADIAIYLLGLAEILNIDLEKEIINKIKKNQKRKYKKINGVVTKINNK